MYMMAPLGEHYDLGFGAIGDAFRDAAETLRKANGTKRISWNHLPETYLLRHAVELYLKSGIIIMHRKLRLPYGSEPHSSTKPTIMTSSGKRKSLFTIHDVTQLYAHWKKLIVEHKDKLGKFTSTQPDMTVPQELDAWIGTLGKTDPGSDYFRYPISTNNGADNEKSPFKEVCLESFVTEHDKGKEYVKAMLVQGGDGESVRVFAYDSAASKDVVEAVRLAADMLNNFHAMMRFVLTDGW